MPELRATADPNEPAQPVPAGRRGGQAVMIGLLLASIWTWAIIFTHSIRLRRINRATDRFESEFWATNDIDAFHSQRGSDPADRRSSCLPRWTSGAGRPRPRPGRPRRHRERLASPDERRRRRRARPSVGPPQHPRHRRLGGALRRPVRHRMGIMRSFTAIAGANNTSLAVVAQVAEALFATAIGLFAAIPASSPTTG